MASTIKEGILTIGQFTGIDTSRGLYSKDYSTSYDAINFIARNGFLRTFKGVHAEYSQLPVNGKRLFQAFFRTQDNADMTCIMAFGGGKVYALLNNNWVKLGDGFSSDEWQCVNYRKDDTDLLIMTNGHECMRTWNGTDTALSTITPEQGQEPIVFSHLTLIYERLWGAVHPDTPDRIYWSESFAPDNWEFNPDLPDSGGGFVDVATFDGGRIRAVKAAFDDVLIFKDKSMHRLNGTYPGDFNLTQVYGTEGTLASKTIVNTADRLYFLSSDGLCVYDGMTVSSLAHTGDRKLKYVWQSLDPAHIADACAVICDDVLYMAVPLLDGSEVPSENNRVIEYNLRDGTYNIVAIDGITDWLVYREGQQETLYCLIDDQIYRYDSGTSMPDGGPVEAVWTTPYIDCGTLASKKATGRIYMSVYAKSLDVTKKPQIRLTMISDKGKERMKVLDLNDGTTIIRKRVKVRGRAFRLRIENVDGNPLTINKGLQIAYEEDSD